MTTVEVNHLEAFVDVEVNEVVVEVEVVGTGPKGDPGTDGFDGDAADVPFTPAAPGDWDTPPDQVGEALDELAGRGTGVADGSGTIQRWGLGSQERIALLATGTPIAVYDTGVWDDLQLREPGQAIWDPVTEQWIDTYSARRASDAFAAIGAALSDDGVTWTPHPQNPIAAVGAGPHANDAHEDPYVAKDLTTGEVWRDSSGRALMFTEEKDGATQLGINLFRSGVDSLSDWTLFGQVLDVGDTGAWDESDRDSPVVFHHGGWLWMLFEGRDMPGQQGEIGLAASQDEGETWSILAGPWIERGPVGSWFSLSLVPDDIILVDGAVVLLCHGQGDDEVYHCGRFAARTNPFTNDGVSWTGTGVEWELVDADPIDAETDTIMCFGNDPTKAIHIDDAGALRVQLIVPGSVPPLDLRVSQVEGDVETLTQQVSDLDEAVQPLAGLDVEVSDLTEVVDGVSDDVDELELVVAAESALNDDQDLLIGRIAPRTAVAEFDGHTGDFGGPTPGGSATLPGAVIESTAPPYPNTSSCSRFAFSPAPSTAEARLIGAKVRLSLDGVDLTDVVANVILSDMGTFLPMPARFATTGAWEASNPTAYATADINDAAVADEQEVVFHLDPVIDGAEAGDYAIVVGYQSVGASPDIGAGSTINVHSVDWTWDDEAEGGGGVTEGDVNDLIAAASEWTTLATHTTASSNDWPTFTSVPTHNRYLLRWRYSATVNESSVGSLFRNLSVVFDSDTTSGSYFNNTSSAAAVTVTGVLGQGGPGFGSIEFSRGFFNTAGTDLHGVVGVAEAAAAAAGGGSQAVRSAHSYRLASGSVPPLTSWALSASNNDAWTAGITFELLGAD